MLLVNLFFTNGGPWEPAVKVTFVGYVPTAPWCWDCVSGVFGSRTCPDPDRVPTWPQVPSHITSAAPSNRQIPVTMAFHFFSSEVKTETLTVIRVLVWKAVWFGCLLLLFTYVVLKHGGPNILWSYSAAPWTVTLFHFFWIFQALSLVKSQDDYEGVTQDLTAQLILIKNKPKLFLMLEIHTESWDRGCGQFPSCAPLVWVQGSVQVVSCPRVICSGLF